MFSPRRVDTEDPGPSGNPSQAPFLGAPDGIVPVDGGSAERWGRMQMAVNW